MGDWSDNLDYEHREHYTDVKETDDTPCNDCEYRKEHGCERWSHEDYSCVFDEKKSEISKERYKKIYDRLKGGE